jgi:hypothetical protein
MSRSYKNVRHERFEKVSKHERRTNTRQIRRQAHVQLARGEEGGIVENILTYHSEARANFAELDATWTRK